MIVIMIELNLKKYLNQFKDIKISKLIPLMQYDQNWGLPDKYKVEGYTTQIKVHKNLVKINRLRLLGRISRNCKKPITKKVYKGGLRRQGLEFCYKNRELWAILKSNWPVTNKNLDLRCLIKNNWVYFVVPKNYIGVWYKYGRGRINFVIIPEKIQLVKEFWETFGILFGEMLRKGRRISIANTSPKVINCILNYFDKSGLIKLDSWRITININGRDIYDNKLTYERRVKDYWSSVLLNKEIKAVRWCDYSSTLNPNLGQINLDCNNRSLTKIIFYLIKYVRKNVLKDKQDSIDFLRGLIAAEGSADKDHSGRLRSVRIASKLKEEREFYHSLLKKVGIKAQLYSTNHFVESSGFSNFILFLKYGLLELNEKRNDSFIKRFSNLLYTKASFLLLNDLLTVPEIVKLLKLNDYRNLNKNLSKITELGYIQRIKTSKGFRYSLSPKFKQLLQPLRTARGFKRQTMFPIPTP